MIVYHVFWLEVYVGHHLMGSFSTKEKAEQFLKKRGDSEWYISEDLLDKGLDE